MEQKASVAKNSGFMRSIITRATARGSAMKRVRCDKLPLGSGVRLGPYRIEAPIGSGGMGEVYRARDTRLDRTVAIKLLAADVAADPQFRARFDREARTISSLDHPHICTLFDIGHDEPSAVDYLVMQHLEGETLAERLGRGVPLPVDE